MILMRLFDGGDLRDDERKKKSGLFFLSTPLIDEAFYLFFFNF